MMGRLLPQKLPDQLPNNRAPVGRPNLHYLHSRRRSKTPSRLLPGYDPNLRPCDGLGCQKRRCIIAAPSSSLQLETDLPRRLRLRPRTSRWVISCIERPPVSRLHSLLQLMNRGLPLPLFLQHPRDHDRSRLLRRGLRRLLSLCPRLCLQNPRSLR